MEPVEINAGEYYLRRIRADERIDDRPAIVSAFADAEMRRWVTGYHVPDLRAATEYVRRRDEEWQRDSRCSWAVAEPMTGEMLAEIGLKNLDLEAGSADVACWTHPDHRGRGVLVRAIKAALRFGFHGLGLQCIGYRHASGNDASRRVAEKCGFRLLATVASGTMVGNRHDDLLVWSISPTNCP